MKSIITELFYFSIITLLVTGCVAVEETLYLRDADVTGALPHTPIHLTDSTEYPSVTLSPKFSFSTGNYLKGEVEQYSTYNSLDTVFIPTDSKLNWDITSVNAGFDMDIRVFKAFAVSLGIDYSSRTEFSAISGYLGVGFIQYNEETAFRVDLGLHLHQMRYDAYTVVHTVTTNFFGERDEYVGFYHDVGNSMQIDPYINLTFNTTYKNWPVNFFINAGYIIHTLFSFRPTTTYLFMGPYTVHDLRGSSTAGFINITPGVYLDFGESGRVLIGSRFYFETMINGADPKLYILPLVQFDFRL